MSPVNRNLTAAVEAYFSDLAHIRALGGATSERPYYPALANLLNAVGATLRTKVFCVGELAEQGVGHPDFGFCAARQVQRGRPCEGQTPEHGETPQTESSGEAGQSGCYKWRGKMSIEGAIRMIERFKGTNLTDSIATI